MMLRLCGARRGSAPVAFSCLVLSQRVEARNARMRATREAVVRWALVEHHTQAVSRSREGSVTLESRRRLVSFGLRRLLRGLVALALTLPLRLSWLHPLDLDP